MLLRSTNVVLDACSRSISLAIAAFSLRSDTVTCLSLSMNFCDYRLKGAAPERERAYDETLGLIAVEDAGFTTRLAGRSLHQRDRRVKPVLGSASDGDEPTELDVGVPA